MNKIDHIHSLAAQARFPGMDYLEWLKWFHQILKPMTYIEIGVESGQSLQFAKSPTRGIGIDPELKVVHSQQTWVKLFGMTSDDFFASYDLRQVMEHDVVDFAFIDGLHTFDQALKDFMNIEKYSNKNTVVAFHDIFPVTPITAERERKTFFWLGDTWKVIPILRLYRPDLKVITIPTYPSGLAIVTHLDRQSNVLYEAYKNVINKFMGLAVTECLNEIDSLLNVIPNETVAVTKFLGEEKKEFPILIDNPNTNLDLELLNPYSEISNIAGRTEIENYFHAIVSNYLQISSEMSGPTLLRNQVEMDICQKFSVGDKVLKINHDLSPSPGLTQINDESVDTLIALDLLTEIPDWVHMLGKLSKKICLDGNIIANFYSLEHLESFETQPLESLGIFKNAVSLQQVVRAAEQLSLNVIAVIPYGFADKSSRYQHPFTKQILTETKAWQRHLSWVLVDKKLLNFFCFIEQSLIQYLPIKATGRFIVVFQKSAKLTYCFDTNKKVNINNGFNFGLLSPFLSYSEHEWKKALNDFLENKRHAVIFFLFWISFWKNPSHFGYESFLNEKHRHRLELWWQQEITDQKALMIARQWYLQDRIKQALTCDDVNVGSCMEWYLIPDILRDYFHAFEENSR